MSTAQYERMTGEPVGRLTLSLAVPAVIGMMITTIYNMVDTWFVAKLGTQAVAACGVTLSIQELTMSVGYWFGMGGGTAIGLLLGARRTEEAGRIGSTAFFTTLLLGTLCALLGNACIGPLMRFLGASATILPYAVAYGRFILLCFPVMAGSLVLSTILRCEGKMKLSMLGIASGGVLNMLLDPLFIFGLRLGVTGAALATFLSQLAGLALLLFFFLSGRSETKLSPRLFTPRAGVYRRILVTGLPSLTRHGVTTVANIAMNTAAGLYGGDVLIASLSIVGKIMALLMAVIKGIFQGSTTIFSYNKGAGRTDRVRAAYRFALSFTTGITLVYAAVLTFTAEGVLSLFGAADPLIVLLGARALLIQVYALVLMPFNFSGNSLLQSVGEAWKSTFLAALPQGVFYIPAVFLLPLWLGQDGVLLAPALGQVLTAVVSVPVIRGYWRRMKEEPGQASYTNSQLNA